MNSITAKHHLSKSAFELKKSWLIASQMAGINHQGPEVIVPNYATWSKLLLKKEIQDLTYDVRDMMKGTLIDPAKGLRPNAVKWLAAQYDRWEQEGFGLLILSTAQDFERNVGELVAKSHLDFPPYAEVLIQTGISVAFRHPEDMLVRDLECCYSLYLDAGKWVKNINWDKAPFWGGGASENVQTLGRTTILTCFNLLESFVSGLARSYFILHPNLDEKTEKRLLTTYGSIISRLESVLKIISGKDLSMDFNEPPFSILFGKIKQYRDSIVHCEPGEQSSFYGYTKQNLFHGVTPGLVEEAIEYTKSVIQLVWREIYGKAGPEWLIRQTYPSHSKRINLTLIPPSN